MGLQVWLPLNGDLTNQGLSNTAITGSNITYNTSGKIGQCAVFNGSNSYISFTNPISVNTTEFSYSCWINVSSVSGNQCLFNARTAAGGGLAIFFIGSSIRFDMGSQATFSGYTVPINTWIHVCVTRNASGKTLYINGNKITTVAAGTISGMTSGLASIGCSSANSTPTNNPINGKLNDVRIYDHCLSPKEVKEISKGLVLHYRLAGPGGENLTKGNNTYEQNSASTDGCFWFSGSNFNCKPSTTYTLSIDIDGTISNFHGGSASTDPTKRWASMWFYLCKTGTSTNAAGSYDTPINLKSTNYNFRKIGPTRYAWTYTTPADARSLSIRGNTYSNGTDAIKVKFWNPKIEEGSIATPWCPRSDEPIYTALGYNNNIEYDCSGYRRNGTKSGNITWDVDSPRYATSYKFQKSSGIFCQPNLTLSQFTIAFWGKHTETGKMLMGSNGSLTDLSSDWYWYGDNSFKYPGGEYYYAHNAGPAKVNEWCHYVAVYDGAKIQIYRNSIDEGSQAKTGPLPLNKLSVGNGFSSANYWENGNVADFRIYATALSAVDIAELYHTAAMVDNQYNDYAYEFIEDTVAGIKKTGIWETPSSINENEGGTSSVSATNLSANQYLEI